MNDVKLVLLDLDGTLLDENSKVPSNFDEVVNRLNEKGIKIGIASGRNYSSMQFLFPNSYDKMVCITCNGANIYVDGKEIYKNNVNPKLIKKVIKITRSLNGATAQLLTTDGVICEEGDIYKDLFNKHGYRSKGVSNLENYLDDIVMVTVHSNNYPNGFVDKYEPLKDELMFSGSWKNCVDFMPLNTTKGTGTKIVCDYLNILTDNVMALGDQDNDLQILNIVGYPVAMKNGNENVKRVSKDITPKTNIENGALEYLISKFL